MNNADISLPADAVGQLEADHRHIRQLFKRLKNQRSDACLTAVVQAICDELTLYLTIKEDVFYPALRSLSAAHKQHVSESMVGHFTLRAIMETLDGEAPDDPLFSIKVRSLKRHFINHVEDEERRLFPDARSLLSPALDQRLLARKRELVDELLTA